MKKTLFVLIIVLVALGFAYSQSIVEINGVPTQDYENLVGWGTETRGGLDGRIIKVTNLNASGEGSFREAVCHFRIWRNCMQYLRAQLYGTFLRLCERSSGDVPGTFSGTDGRDPASR